MSDDDNKTCAPQQGADVEVVGPGGIAARARNLRKLDYAITISVAVFGFMFYQHMTDSKVAMVEQTQANREVAGAIRYFSCIISIAQDQRMEELRSVSGICAKIGKP